MQLGHVLTLANCSMKKSLLAGAVILGLSSASFAQTPWATLEGNAEGVFFADPDFCKATKCEVNGEPQIRWQVGIMSPLPGQSSYLPEPYIHRILSFSEAFSETGDPGFSTPVDKPFKIGTLTYGNAFTWPDTDKHYFPSYYEYITFDLEFKVSFSNASEFNFSKSVTVEVYGSMVHIPEFIAPPPFVDAEGNYIVPDGGGTFHTQGGTRASTVDVMALLKPILMWIEEKESAPFGDDMDQGLDPVASPFGYKQVLVGYDLVLVGLANPTGGAVIYQGEFIDQIPEPETWIMLLAGLGIVGAVTRRQRIKAAM